MNLPCNLPLKLPLDSLLIFPLDLPLILPWILPLNLSLIAPLKFPLNFPLNITSNAENYKPGDIVAYNLGGGTTHIAIVVDVKSDDGERYQIVHNIGGGQVMEDTLFSYHKIIGHYRLF